MASIRKRGMKWQVQIRRDGRSAISKSFLSREDAVRWGRDQDRRIDAGELLGQKDAAFGDLIEIYQRKITPLKRSAESERFLLRQISKHPLATIRLRHLQASDIAEFRDYRLLTVSGSTVRKELGLIASILKTAAHEWGLLNRLEAVRQVRKPSPGRSRERRLQSGEWQALQTALAACRNSVVRDVTVFALATGMRRGEVLSLEWRYVDLQKRTAFLPMTKNGDSREVPLSLAAIEVLQSRRAASAESEIIFPVTANAFRLAWDRVRRRAGLSDFHFHDLRHEAISRFFELGLSVPEVSLISGHRDSRMLFRYTHMRPELVAKRLDGK